VRNNYGYYDPRTPGHCALNREEFEKACLGVISAYLGGWTNYIGVEGAKRAVSKLVESPTFDLEQCPPDSFDSFGELCRCCRRSLSALCEAWSKTLGTDAVSRILVELLESDDGWENKRIIADHVVERFIELDRRERESN